MGKIELIDRFKMLERLQEWNTDDKQDSFLYSFALARIIEQPTVEAIPKANVYKAIQEMMKYEHDGFINISLARLDEILKKCGVSEDGKID